MDGSEQADALHRAISLAEEAISSASAEELVEWVLENEDAIDDSFFTVLDTIALSAAEKGNIEKAETGWWIADTVRDTLAQSRDIARQRVLFDYALEATSHSELRQRLEEIAPQITPNFFRILAAWADQSRNNNEAGINLCERLLDVIEFADLREDWLGHERTIIWRSAWFLRRHSNFAELVEPNHPGALLHFDTLHNYVLEARELSRVGMPSLALAILNVVLEASPRAVHGEPPISYTDDLRVDIFATGGRVIRQLFRFDTVPIAIRALDRARAELDKALVRPKSKEQEAAHKMNAIWILDEMGQLELRLGNAERALELHKDSLNMREEILAQAQNSGLSEEFIGRLRWGVPNSLSKLARAEVMTWDLDSACEHYRQAIDEYRQLGRTGRDLAPYIAQYAEAEILRTNFERAEALLDEARRLEWVEEDRVEVAQTSEEEPQ